MALHPDFGPGSSGPHTTDDYCRPYVASGLGLAAARAQVAGQAEALGWRLRATEADPHLAVDGRIVRPETDGRWARFALPATATRVTLMSDSFVPHDTAPEQADRRRLGLMVSGIVIHEADGRGHAVGLDDPRIGAGFHALEAGTTGPFRWTDGAATLGPALWAAFGPGCTLHVKYAARSAALAWCPPPPDTAVPDRRETA